MTRLVALGVVAAMLALSTAQAEGPRPDPAPMKRVVGYGQVRYGGLGPERWAQRWRIERRRTLALEVRVAALTATLRSTRRVLRQSPHVVEAVNLACATYGYCSTLWRKAGCETRGTFDPRSWNPTSVGGEHASGLFQFLPSTFDSTPYARFSIWSPYANALAAGWMHVHGRGGEWACH